MRKALAILGAIVLIGTAACDAMVADPAGSNSSRAPESSSSYTPLASQTFSGTGDDVIDIGEFTDPAILTFSCPGCASNTAVKTDGRESLLVNAIGGYSGSHFINIHDNSMTTRITVTAEGAWNMSIADITTASGQTSGRGDTALYLAATATKARITNQGEGNFVVQVYSFSGSGGLAVNEIGSYQGTVAFDAPALVQVISEGAWSIDAS